MQITVFSTVSVTNSFMINVGSTLQGKVLLLSFRHLSHLAIPVKINCPKEEHFADPALSFGGIGCGSAHLTIAVVPPAAPSPFCSLFFLQSCAHWGWLERGLRNAPPPEIPPACLCSAEPPLKRPTAPAHLQPLRATTKSPSLPGLLCKHLAPPCSMPESVSWVSGEITAGSRLAWRWCVKTGEQRRWLSLLAAALLNAGGQASLEEVSSPCRALASPRDCGMRQWQTGNGAEGG